MGSCRTCTGLSLRWSCTAAMPEAVADKDKEAKSILQSMTLMCPRYKHDADAKEHGNDHKMSWNDCYSRKQMIPEE